MKKHTTTPGTDWVCSVASKNYVLKRLQLGKKILVSKNTTIYKQVLDTIYNQKIFYYTLLKNLMILQYF